MSGHEYLVQQLTADGVLKTPALVSAFTQIDRRDFVPAAQAAAAYENRPLPIGDGQTISQPWTVAFMLELLQPQPGARILEIGYGSGWQTALLAAAVGEAGRVVALEIVPALCAQGRQNLVSYDFLSRGIVELHCQSGQAGFASAAPYDGIIAAAAGEQLPSAWQEQLAAGGCIVAPVGSAVVRVTRQADDTWEREEFPGFAFVPLVNDSARSYGRSTE